MAWTPPADFSHLEIVTATKLNTHLRDNMKEVWRELAYVEFTANVSRSGSDIDVVSAGAITFTAEPILIEFFAPSASMASAASMVVSLFDGAVDLGVLTTLQTATFSAGSLIWPVGTLRKRLTPTAASHTYKVRLTAGAGTINAGAGGAGASVPGSIRILQKGGA